ncbi:lipoyl(octanoyl) transferase LipB [Hirschia litorea]|uniref:Octanoyltransferase n=1 Tax=Hirschia litorea TaxID=1199156 RepID=A0ABW2IH04_9PROT
MSASISSNIHDQSIPKIEWAISDNLVDYNKAVEIMEARVAAISAGEAAELVWLLEHPPVYTAGTSAKKDDLTDPDRFPVIDAGRGGQFTYHGPGQRVAYVMLNVGKRGRDVRAFVSGLEEWVIATLGEFNIRGERRDGRVGVWVDRTASTGQMHEDKIAAIGVRLRKWVSFHGISLNVEPNLEHFSGIIPCGISQDGLGVTSLADLGYPVTLPEVDSVLRGQFEKLFGETVNASPPA